MKIELEKYLDKVTASIPNPEDAEMVRLELEDHILTKVEIMLLSGVDEDSAIRQVLIDMGNEEELSEDLGIVHANYKMPAKIIYESEKGQCKALAERMGKELGIPYADVRDNPQVQGKELLIVIRKGRYGGGVRPELARYLQRLQRDKIKLIVMVYTSFRTGNRPIYQINRHMDDIRDFKGHDGKFIKKLLRNKGIEAIEERYCFRSYKRLGRISEGEIMTIVRYFAKIIGVYI